MRTKIYSAFVNKHNGISVRYHKMHDGSSGCKKVISWLYLFWLNFAYYVLFCRFLGKEPEMETYETKALPVKESESEEHLHLFPELSTASYVEKLKNYDIISFDVFDTLLFRPVCQPTDVFYLIGERMGIADFKNIRMRAEWDARVKSRYENGHMEITLEEIWQQVSEEVGCSKERGMKAEQETELSLCYANPFMLAVWNELKASGKEIVVVSDMYLSKNFIAAMLERNGFSGAEKIYVSCEYGKNKAAGDLFELVKEEYSGRSFIHVGDNPHSDEKMAKKHGFAVCPYPNVNHNVRLYRPFDMSYLVGSAYRGIVSNHLYNGTKAYGMEYEYGFIYGGLFVLGYCGFIHDYCRKNQVDRLLFLSRDGDVLKQAYDLLYPPNDSVYAYWSRKAAVKLMADDDRHDFFRRFVDHKVNQRYTVKEILHAMELDFLTKELGDWQEIRIKWKERQYSAEKKVVDLKPEDELTDKNAYSLRCFVEAKWEKVQKTYETQQKAAEKYYRKLLSGGNKAAVVDIGWAGSGALALSHLTKEVWKIPCEIVGIIAGTNTIHNAEPDATEPFLQSGRLVSYLYSQSHNRDLLKKHDPNKDYNVFWELLLSSPTPQFSGFASGNACGKETEDRYLGDLDITLHFGKQDVNQEGIREIQRGILDFVSAYQEHFRDFPYMFRVGGRDAYAPMLAAASYGEKYLKTMEKKFRLEINIG